MSCLLQDQRGRQDQEVQQVRVDDVAHRDQSVYVDQAVTQELAELEVTQRITASI